MIRNSAHPQTNEPADASTAALLAHADQCVMCGLCVPRCPTYRVRGEEGESPRGRVALARAVLSGALPTPTPSLLAHLDHCLTCGICESVCPSDVRFLDLITGTRAVLRDRGAASPTSPRWMRRPSVARLLTRIARAVPAAFSRWLPRGAAREANAIARAIPRRATDAALHVTQRGAAPRRGHVALFTGCTGTSVDRDSVAAAMAVLAHIGYDVTRIADGACCGALDRHAGARRTARLAREHTVRRLAMHAGADAIVHLNSGCDVDLAALATRNGASIIAWDAFVLAALREPPARRTHAQTPVRVALHIPCTQRRLVTAGATGALLGLVANVQVIAIEDTASCCGAAGTYALQHPDIATPLRDTLVARISAIAPDHVVTTNIGCRLQIQAGLRAAGIDVPVQHPAAVLRDILRA
jgi:glycolate oxidase iron-sulfur subunit